MAEHYFTANPSSRAREHKVSYRARGVDYVVTVPEGVFSAHRLDLGTQVLLAKAPYTELSAPPAAAPPETARDYAPLLVDVGCGWGPIAFALANEHPGARVLGVDVNERALAAAQKNAARLGLENAVTIAAADQALAQLQAPDAQPVDLIWSNPPIRVGKEALHELLTNWLALLRPGTGEAYWVVQKNLGADSLTAWLNQQGYPSEKVASQKGYRVIRSSRS